MRESSSDKPDLINRADLVKDVWELTLSTLITTQTRLPCCYVFKSVTLTPSSDSINFLRIKGKCKSNICQNPLFAYIAKDPGDTEVTMTLRTGNTLFDKNHEVLSRPTKGIIREGVGRQAFREGAYNFRNRLIGEQVELGGKIPPTIPQLHVINQSKQEYIDKKLKVEANDGKDLRITIMKMQDSGDYASSILDFNSYPFTVTYSSPSQRYTYQRYHQVTKKKSIVYVDATGSVAKKFERANGTKSGHIFLYSIVINFEGTTLSIHHSLTESQTTDNIYRFLRIWLHPPAPHPALPKPSQLICDHSLALMNASSLALNNHNIKFHAETLFLYATGHPEFKSRPVYTYIRLDLAHIFRSIRRWTAFKRIPHQAVRDFYMYSVGLMADCQTIEEFEEILLLTLTVGLHAYEDASIMAIPDGTVEDAREAMEKMISHRIKRKTEEKEEEKEDESGQDSKQECTNEDPSKSSKSRLHEWIDRVVEKAKFNEAPNKKCNKVNPFYVPDLIEAFMSLYYEFTLWTAVGIAHFVGHGSSSAIEGYFHLWKNIERKNYAKLMRIDKHIKLHLNNSKDQSRVLSAQLSEYIDKGEPMASPIPKKTILKSSDTSASINNEESLLKNHNESKNPSRNPVQVTDNSDTDSDSDTVDNWRNKGFEGQLKKAQLKMSLPKGKKRSVECASEELKWQEKPSRKQGKFVKSNPYIAVQNKLLNDRQTGWIVENGNRRRKPELIEGKAYFIEETCHYDALIQILMTMTFDSDDFKQLIMQEDNETLKLVLQIVEHGITNEVYKKRALILKHLFQDRIKANESTQLRVLSYTINTKNNVTNTWNSALTHVPSLSITYNCNRCGIDTYSQKNVSVNHEIIMRDGFKVLQEALLSNPGIYSAQCKKCSNQCIMTIVPNYCISIELDIRGTPPTESGMRCKLADFPKQITLDESYRLTGVVGFKDDHYIAYCKRANGKWQVHNDCAVKVEPCGPTKVLEPHFVTYLREDLTCLLPSWELENKENTSPSQTVKPSSEQIKLKIPKLDDEPETHKLGSPSTNCTAADSHYQSELPMNRETNQNREPDLDDKSGLNDNENRNEIPSSSLMNEMNQDSHPIPNEASNSMNRSGEVDSSTEIIADGKKTGPKVNSQINLMKPVAPGVSNANDMHQENNVPQIPTLHCVQLAGRDFYVENCNGFDALIHTFHAIACEDAEYRDVIGQSRNSMLKLTAMLGKNGVDETFCQQRIALIRQFFPHSIHPYSVKGKSQRLIRLNGTIHSIWNQCMQNEPSLFKVYECSPCTAYTIVQTHLEAERTKLARYKFRNFEKSMELYRELFNVQCSRCPQLCTVKFTYNFQVYLKLLCVTASGSYESCKLKDIQKQLQLIHVYRLASVTAYNEGYYQVYILKMDGSWAMFRQTNYEFQMCNCSEDITIIPHGALYVL